VKVTNDGICHNEASMVTDKDNKVHELLIAIKQVEKALNDAIKNRLKYMGKMNSKEFEEWFRTVKFGEL
jgi:hypothetical protein